MRMAVSTPTATVPDSRLSGEPAPRRVPRWRRGLRPYLLSVPALLATIAILYPFGLGVYYTFLDYSATNPNPSFVGLSNFSSVLGSSAFWSSIRITLTYTIVATGVETLLGIGIALLLNRSSLVGKVLERVFIVPFMFAPVIAGTIWGLMYNPQFGIINHLFGLGSTFNWLSPGLALWSSIIVDIWVFTPFIGLIVLAGLRSLPKEPLEAAEVEGASFFYRLRRLILPMLGPYILVAVIFRFVACMKIFDIIYVLTQGGPGTSTTTLQVAAYTNSMTNLNFSLGDTYMLLLWIIVYIVVQRLVKVLGQAQSRAAGEAN